MDSQIYSHESTGQTLPHRFVGLNADKTVSTSGATIAPYGVNGLKAEDKQMTDVHVFGLIKVETGGAFNAGAEIKSDADGRAVKCADGEHSFIFARETSGGAGEFVEATK